MALVQRAQPWYFTSEVTYNFLIHMEFFIPLDFPLQGSIGVQPTQLTPQWPASSVQFIAVMWECSQSDSLS